MTDASLRIEQVRTRADLKRFLRVPWRIYADDPAWIPPLLFERLAHLDPRKNPFFDRAEVAYWVAMRDGVAVGRISAQVDHAHLERHNDGTGHFGFLEADDDAEVFAGLLGTAEAWLRAHGLRRIAGPFSLSINDESGLLVDGLDHPPYLMMGHARPYYAGQVEAQGYRKAKDLIAFMYTSAMTLPESVQRLVARAKAQNEVRFRPLDKSRFDEEIRTIVDIFNDAWSDNWGFVPMSDAEVAFLGKSIKPIAESEFVSIAEVGGEPAAMTVTLPNVNAAIADLDGRLLPFGWVKLLWRLKVAGVDSIRMPLMGVRKRYQGTSLGAALAFGVIDAIRSHHRARGVHHGELSWVLKDNTGVRRVIETMGAEPYKTYRIYAKDLV